MKDFPVEIGISTGFSAALVSGSTQLATSVCGFGVGVAKECRTTSASCMQVIVCGVANQDSLIRGEVVA